MSLVQHCVRIFLKKAISICRKMTIQNGRQLPLLKLTKYMTQTVSHELPNGFWPNWWFRWALNTKLESMCDIASCEILTLHFFWSTGILCMLYLGFPRIPNIFQRMEAWSKRTIQKTTSVFVLYIVCLVPYIVGKREKRRLRWGGSNWHGTWFYSYFPIL